VVSAYKDAERVNVELVERTTIEDGKNSETLYDTYVVSDVDLSNGTDNTADYHHELI
jgi:cellulose synthase/poly-beta-1,6-N-acetylglucosamine synthase-like glycosyltransferase